MQKTPTGSLNDFHTRGAKSENSTFSKKNVDLSVRCRQLVTKTKKHIYCFKWDTPFLQDMLLPPHCDVQTTWELTVHSKPSGLILPQELCMPLHA